MTSLRTCLAVFVLAAIASPAAAAPKPPAAEAEAAIRHGVELRKTGEDEAALGEFKRAYGLVPSPRAAAQMGMAEQSLGRWPDAEVHLAEAIGSKGDAWVDKNRGVLEASLRTVRSRVGRLHIAGDPPGAEIAVDGKPQGKLPVEEPLRLLPGTARVEVRAPGYAPFVMSVSVPAGQVTEVAVKLERERGIPTPDPSAADGPEIHQPGPQPVAVGGGPPSWVPTTRLVTSIATGVAVAAGITWLALRESQLSDFNGVPCQFDSDTNVVHGPKGAGDATCRSKLDTANTSKSIAVASFVGAGVLAVTSAVLYIAF
jgi:hypothetical protein